MEDPGELGSSNKGTGHIFLPCAVSYFCIYKSWVDHKVTSLKDQSRESAQKGFPAKSYVSVASASYSLGPVGAAWTLKDGNINGVCVAPSVVEEGKKKKLQSSVVGLNPGKIVCGAQKIG